jgi:hypothetical protein
MYQIYVTNLLKIEIKVTTPNKNTICLRIPKKWPKLQTTCFQFQHKFLKITIGSWGVFWGNQWKVKHFVLEGVQLRISLVSYVGYPMMST